MENGVSAVGLMDNIADVPNTLGPYLELNVVYQRPRKIRQLPGYPIGIIYPTTPGHQNYMSTAVLSCLGAPGLCQTPGCNVETQNAVPISIWDHVP